MAKRRSGISQKQLNEILERPFYKNNPRGKKAATRCKAYLARGSTTVKKCNEQAPLDKKAENPAGMVYINGPLFVRIVRLIPKGGRVYDDDNYTGGCKELRDAIAAMLGLSGDSATDGIEFAYEQERDPSGVGGLEIEIYRIEE